MAVEGLGVAQSARARIRAQSVEGRSVVLIQQGEIGAVQKAHRIGGIGRVCGSHTICTGRALRCMPSSQFSINADVVKQSRKFWILPLDGEVAH